MINLISQTMFRDVFALNSPHGPLIVWESLYPGDLKDKYRFCVTVDGCFAQSVLVAFESDGFINTCGCTKGECIAEVKKLQDASGATQHPRCKTDDHIRNKRNAEWQRVSKKYATQDASVA